MKIRSSKSRDTDIFGNRLKIGERVRIVMQDATYGFKPETLKDGYYKGIEYGLSTIDIGEGIMVEGVSTDMLLTKYYDLDHTKYSGAFDATHEQYFKVGDYALYKKQPKYTFDVRLYKVLDVEDKGIKIMDEYWDKAMWYQSFYFYNIPSRIIPQEIQEKFLEPTSRKSKY